MWIFDRPKIGTVLICPESKATAIVIGQNKGGKVLLMDSGYVYFGGHVSYPFAWKIKIL